MSRFKKRFGDELEKEYIDKLVKLDRKIENWFAYVSQFDANHLGALAQFALKYDIVKPIHGGDYCQENKIRGIYMPHIDHSSIWISNQENYDVLVAHLYPFGQKQMKDISDWAYDKGFDVEVWSSLSFWNYGSTIAIVVKLYKEALNKMK